MKVVHLSTLGTGGASLAAINTHLALLDQGIDSHFLYLIPTDEKIPRSTLYRAKTTFGKIRNSISSRMLIFKRKKLLKSIELSGKIFSLPYSPYKYLHYHPLVKNADIINLHWVASFVDYPSFFAKINKPVVITLHDENPYLGGFHYYKDYDQVKNEKTDQLEQKLIEEKKLLIHKKKIFVAAPSKWIFEKAKSSKMFGDKDVSFIPNGIDTTLFFPQNKMNIRAHLKIPSKKFIILIIADNLQDERKGGMNLIQALGLTKKHANEILVCTVGRGSLSLPGYEKIDFGFIPERRRMAEIYNLADLFIAPSLADNLPNTILESLACGTPVLAFNSGGIPDLVIENQTGFLVETGNYHKLAEQIILAKNNPYQLKLISNQATKFVKENFSLQLCGKKYQELYIRIIS